MLLNYNSLIVNMLNKILYLYNKIMLSNYNFKGEDYRMKIYKSFDDMRDALKDETGFREFLEQAKWRGTPVCPHCGCISAEHYKLKTNGEFKGLYKCKHCRKRFTVTTKTMFDRTHQEMFAF